MNINLTSVCGCGIDLSTDGATGRVTLHSDDAAMTRSFAGAAAGVEGVISFLWSAAVAIESDHQAGLVRDDFCVSRYYEPLLNLDVEIDLVDDANEYPRAKFTLLSDDEDSLDYCHLGVTVDLSLRQFRELTNIAYAASLPGCVRGCWPIFPERQIGPERCLSSSPATRRPTTS